ncbi:MAG: hypothetical protein FWD19_00305 [Defluviitaleaceae bacterium]|nr:hypothetical protein [Defluviitaleaceae bacterium]
MNNDPRMNDFEILERENFELKQKILFARGKKIIFAIAVLVFCNAAADIFFAFRDANFISLAGSAIYISFAVALVKRFEPARYFFIAILILYAVSAFGALGEISPNLTHSNTQTMYNAQTGEFFGVPLDIEAPEKIPVSPMYILLSILLAIYIFCAAVLIFSKSVKVYLKKE